MLTRIWEVDCCIWCVIWWKEYMCDNQIRDMDSMTLSETTGLDCDILLNSTMPTNKRSYRKKVVQSVSICRSDMKSKEVWSADRACDILVAYARRGRPASPPFVTKHM